MVFNNYEALLGRYTIRDGGSILLSMGKNLQYNTEFNTYIHEISHMYLTNSTNLGFVLLMLDFELSLSENEKDYQQIKALKKIINLIHKRTEVVQEIFANNYELLWIGEFLDEKLKKKTYKMKTPEYQRYFDALKIINSKNALSFVEKKNYIEKICAYSMNVPIFNNQFVNALKSTSTLTKFFSTPSNNPRKRLENVLEKFKSNVDLDEDYDNETLDFNWLLSALKESGIIKHTNLLFPHIKDIETTFIENGKINVTKIEEFAYIIQEEMDSKIKLFDFQNLKVTRAYNFREHDSFGIFIIKNCNALIDEVNNYYLLKHGRIDKKMGYICGEISKSNLNSYLQSFNIVGVPIYEFDIEKMKPIYLDTIPLPFVVLIDDYNHCKEIIAQLLKKDELIVGDLYDADCNNFFTVLLFRTRNNPNIIFVFPTIKKLAFRILKELHLESKTLFSKDVNYLGILSILENEVKMLEFVFWIFKFLLNESNEDQKSLASLAREIVQNLCNQTLQIRPNRSNYYSILANLPTLNTIGEPFYILMQFENHKNTGKIYAHPDTLGNDCIVFFHDKKSAEKWKDWKLNDPSLQAVGVDKVYWNILKIGLIKTNVNIILFQDIDRLKGQLFDVRTIDYLITINIEYCKHKSL